ncbi:uncharacterized protein MELLADRAFT_70667 [Melampsora larici-populina 98AG31]|uniref:Uncharacterized protein n=1 Tax=Melampsora larici-populina (strain 98AG31 / pathotype 3-4-7) TaxID=747676 RepID=F4R589_MELLP|nr:uncharacterized protein MELLADRAFT_70667 [Melampsora larici-populina 98AG31]EGG12006.1 hypothetical protein MELLADRAFT_70667 [Melampsora larici-populina 98AG31]
MMYQQDPKQATLMREPSGKLKNPYEGVEEYNHQEDRSGTPTQPNLQQSYFALSHPDSLGSAAQSPAPVPTTNNTNTHHHQENGIKEDRAQRTLSVMNGESQYNDFHGF